MARPTRAGQGITTWLPGWPTAGTDGPRAGNGAGPPQNDAGTAVRRLTQVPRFPSLRDMEDPSPSDPTPVLVPSELRRRVESTCSEARVERARSVAADASLREARQAATATRAELDVALASLDQRKLVDHKDQARHTYRMALSVASDATERQHAATTWLRRIDELNRASRGALGQVLLLRARCETLDQMVRDASMASNVQRVRTESADARCIEARQLLAKVDRWAADPVATEVVPVNWAGGGFTGFADTSDSGWDLDPSTLR